MDQKPLPQTLLQIQGNGKIIMAKSKEAKRLATGLAFLTPNILGFLCFTVIPLVISMYMAFTNWDIKLHNSFKDASPNFIFIDNFKRLLQEGDFLRFLGNTLFFMMGIPLSILGSLTGAILLNQDTKGGNNKVWKWLICWAVMLASTILLVSVGMGKSAFVILLCGIGGIFLVSGVAGGTTIYRTLFFIPHFTSGVAVYILWKKLYNPSNGPINNFLYKPIRAINDTVNATPAPAIQNGLFWVTLIIMLLVATWGIRKTWQMWREGDLGTGTVVFSNIFLLLPLIFLFKWAPSPELISTQYIWNGASDPARTAVIATDKSMDELEQMSSLERAELLKEKSAALLEEKMELESNLDDLYKKYNGFEELMTTQAELNKLQTEKKQYAKKVAGDNNPDSLIEETLTNPDKTDIPPELTILVEKHQEIQSLQEQKKELLKKFTSDDELHTAMREYNTINSRKLEIHDIFNQTYIQGGEAAVYLQNPPSKEVISAVFPKLQERKDKKQSEFIGKVSTSDLRLKTKHPAGMTIPLIAVLFYIFTIAKSKKNGQDFPSTFGKGFGDALILCLFLMVVQFILVGISSVFYHLPAWAGNSEGLLPPKWLAEYHWAKPAIMMMGLWGSVGSNNMLLYLAGLNNVPQELYEAADIDGASKPQRFWHITWPQLAPVTFFIFIMSVIHGLQGGFEMARVMTQGGPAGATTTLSYFIFTEGFTTGRLGYASSVAWALFILVFSVTMFNWKFGSRYVND